jgi:hypothetical protein
MADYRIVSPRIYSDEKVRNMRPTLVELEKMNLSQDDIAWLVGNARRSLFKFSINNSMSVLDTETGIYELPRGNISFYSELPLSFVEDAFGMSNERAKMFFRKNIEDLTSEEMEIKKGYFNRDRPFLLEYDTENHMVFVKSFMKYNMNSGYLSTNEKIGDAIVKDYKKTGEKCPKLWQQFSQIYSSVIKKVIKDLDVTKPKEKRKKAILETILELGQKKSEKAPDKNPNLVSAEKMKETIKGLSFQI